MVIIGIDPGVSGAIAVLDDKNLVYLIDTPTVKVSTGKGGRRLVDPLLFNALLGYLKGKYRFKRKESIFIEDVHTWARDSKVGAMSSGRSLGRMEGVFTCWGIKPHFIPSTQWSKVIFGKMERKAKKAEGRELCKLLWPSKKKLFKRVQDDGRADACLIAAYAAQYVLKVARFF